MPVKNIKRKTNNGFEGVITGLNDKEKEIISNSVGIEANPVDKATVTSTKTLYLGSTNLSKLTDEDKAIATNKGWTLA